MLTYNFKRIMAARGIEGRYTFLKKNGFSHNLANRMANNGIDKLSLAHLEQLCKLFHCSPHDLMEWTPANAKEDTPDHPLAGLKKEFKFADLQPILNQLPVDRLNEVAKMIEEMKGRK